MNFSLLSPSKKPIRNHVKTTLFPDFASINTKLNSKSPKDSKYSTGEKSLHAVDEIDCQPFDPADSFKKPNKWKSNKKILTSEELLLAEIEKGKQEMRRLMKKRQSFFIKNMDKLVGKENIPTQEESRPLTAKINNDFADTLLFKKRSREPELEQSEDDFDNELNKMSDGFQNFKISNEEFSGNMLELCKKEVNALKLAERQERKQKKMRQHRPCLGFISL